MKNQTHLRQEKLNGLKQCCRCELFKSKKTEFHKCSINRDGSKYYCKDCSKIEYTARRAKLSKPQKKRERVQRNRWLEDVKADPIRHKKYNERVKKAFDKWVSKPENRKTHNAKRYD